MLAQQFHRADGGLGVCSRELALEHGGAEALVLADAIVEHGFGRRLAALALLRFAESEVVGEGDMLPMRTAEELVERPAPGLAANVPERHLDRPEGPDRGEIDIGVDAAPGGQAALLAAGDVDRVTTDQDGRECLDRRDIGR